MKTLVRIFIVTFVFICSPLSHSQYFTGNIHSENEWFFLGLYGNSLDTLLTRSFVTDDSTSQGKKAQLFGSYGDTHYNAAWCVQGTWIKESFSAYPMTPDTLAIDCRFAAGTNIKYVIFRIAIQDSFKYFSGYYGIIYPTPEWKRMKFDMSELKALGIKHFLKLYLVFTPVAVDSCFVGADIIVDNLRGIDDTLGTVLYDGFGDPLTGILDDVVHNPKDYTLYQNYPNPFNPSTTIRYSLAKSADVTLKVFDLLGREVATLVDGRQSAGGHEAIFTASRLTSGVYVYTLFVNGTLTFTKKMIFLK